MSNQATTLNSTMTWGAAPFVALALSTWLVPEKFLADVQIGFFLYSAMIFSFMTGTLWGGSLTQQPTMDDSTKPLKLAIGAYLFALLAAGIGYFFGATTSIGLMLIAFLALPTIEKVCDLPFPTTYLELRGKINRTVVLTHLVVVIHAIQPHVQ